jgi:hypothetical protein
VVGIEKSEQNGRVQMQERVRGELQDVLGVQKKAWLHGSRSWQAGGRRGGSGGGGARWRGRSRPAWAGEATARVLGRHVARLRAARGWPVRGTWPAWAAGRRAQRNRGAKGWRQTKGTCLQFPESAGSPL